MKTFWPSASKLWIADQCGYPWSPQRPNWPKRGFEPTVEARIGNVFHRATEFMVADAALRGQEEENHDGAPILLEGIDDDLLRILIEQEGAPASCLSKIQAMAMYFVEEYNTHPWMAPSPELPLLVHIESGLVREADRARDEHFKAPDGCIAVTIDLAGIDVATHRLRVRDYKTGWSTSDTPLARDWQLRLEAYAAAIFYEATEVRLERTTYSDDRKPVTEVEPIDAMELGVILYEVRALLARIQTTTAPTMGSGCRRCPIVTVCPITLDMQARVKFGNDAFDPMTWFPIQDSAHAAGIHRRLTLLESAVERWRSEVSSYAKEHGAFHLGGAKWYGPHEKQGSRSVDLRDPRALDVLRKHLTPEGMKVALEQSTSQVALKRAIEAQGGTPGTGKTTDFTKLWQDLLAGGFVTRGAPFAVIHEYTKKETSGDAPANDNRGRDE